MHLSLRTKMLLVMMALFTGVSVTVISCTPIGGNNPPPPSSDGPQFVINSPPDGASVAGPAFFSVQPLNPAEIASVTLEAGGKTLAADFPGEDTFKVFLIPSEFADGPLELKATITGKDGKTSSKSTSVKVIANPPSSTTLSADGAVLGTKEANGATSTLSIPPGTGQGINVSFEAKTKEQIKATTGVDYDALGVTFLGAQEISSSQAINSPLNISSGGFAPMVQPGQVVVNYTIAPDADGDGKGELVVINTATVAPNGDVISDPVPQVQVGGAVVSSRSGTQSLSPLQAGLSGPPGAIIEFQVTGFNPFSAVGNVAEWRCANGTSITLPGSVRTDPNNSSGQIFSAIIPSCPPGNATVSLRNQSTGSQAGPFTVNVTAPAPASQPPLNTLQGLLDDTQKMLENFPSSPQDSQVDEQRKRAQQDMQNAKDRLNELGDDPEMADDLEDAAEPVQEWDGDIPDDPGGGAEDCLTKEAKRALAYQETYYRLLAFQWSDAGELALFEYYWDIAERLNVLRHLPTCGEEDPLPTPSPAPAPNPRPNLGMGSAPPPGAPGGGPVLTPPPENQNGSSLRATQFFEGTPGRFHIKVLSNRSPVSFTGITDAGGYFFIPMIPDGQPFTAIATDTLTGKSRTFEGVGKPVGESVFMFFDFLTFTEGEIPRLEHDTNTTGVLEEKALYSFNGQAGQVVNITALVDRPPVSNFASPLLRVIDPEGNIMRLACCGSATGREIFWVSTNPLELPLSGTYIVELSTRSPEALPYTLGFADIEAPLPITPTNPSLTLTDNFNIIGDLHYYRFSGSQGEEHNVRLDLSDGDLTVRLSVRRDDGGDFFNRFGDNLVGTPVSFTPTTPIGETRRFVLPETSDYIIEIDSNYHPVYGKDSFLGPYEMTVFSFQ